MMLKPTAAGAAPKDPYDTAFYRKYRGFLTRCIRFRWSRRLRRRWRLRHSRRRILGILFSCIVLTTKCDDLVRLNRIKLSSDRIRLQ